MDQSSHAAHHVLTLFEATPVADEIKAWNANLVDLGDAGIIATLDEKAKALHGQSLASHNGGLIQIVATFSCEAAARQFHATAHEFLDGAPHITVHGPDMIALGKIAHDQWTERTGNVPAFRPLPPQAAATGSGGIGLSHKTLH